MKRHPENIRDIFDFVLSKMELDLLIRNPEECDIEIVIPSLYAKIDREPLVLVYAPRTKGFKVEKQEINLNVNSKEFTITGYIAKEYQKRNSKIKVRSIELLDDWNYSGPDDNRSRFLYLSNYQQDTYKFLNVQRIKACSIWYKIKNMEGKSL